MIALPGFLLLILVFTLFQFRWNPALLLVPLGLWTIIAFQRSYIYSGTLSLLWLAVPLTCFFALGWTGENRAYESTVPLAVISLIWVNDTFAYVTGSLLGRHKMAPQLSPGKSWEGFAGGIIFTLAASWVTFKITGVYTTGTWVILAILTSSLSLMGDLFESGLKRKKAVKNTGEILPGHGGILDRFDSLLFVAPGILIFLALLKMVQ
jgi:phosphatidate cytidylyltransferase